MKKIAFFVMIVVLASLYSCRKDRFEPNQPKSMEELKVPANFDWKTTRDLTISLSSSNSGLTEVVNGNNNVVYQRAYLTAGANYTMKITLPAYETLLKIKFQGIERALYLQPGVSSYSVNL
ncbi:MAG: hypothetical protein IPM52_07105 [Bacteroidetes bacterium]|nr:hypothetical protein [Bacteroidota bacterium]